EESVFEFVGKREDIVGVAVRFGAHDPRRSHSADGRGLREPQSHIDGVDAGIDEVAAAKRIVIYPDEMLEAVLHRVCERRIGEALVGIERADEAKRTDLARMHTPNSLDVERVGSRLEINEKLPA